MRIHLCTPTHTHTLQETYLNKRVAHRQTVHLIKMSLICKQCIHLQEQQCNDTDEGLNTHQNHRFVSWQVCECVLCLCSLFVLFVFSLADVHYMHKLKCEVRFFLQDDKLKVRQMKKMSCVENRSVIRPTEKPYFLMSKGSLQINVHISANMLINIWFFYLMI